MMRVLVAAMVIVQVLGAAAYADEFKLTPSVAVRQEYNSNIFFDSSKEEDDTITRVKPGLELLNRTERLDLRLAGFVTPYFYWSKDVIIMIVASLRRGALDGRRRRKAWA
jgi:hypothetical protein